MININIFYSMRFFYLYSVLLVRRVYPPDCASV